MSDERIGTRTEILFLYDITDANPNGDPNDENRPRMDVEVGVAKVSDVRLKRTIRDYLAEVKGTEIFCRPGENPDGTLQEGKDRAQDFYEEIEKSSRKAGSVIEKRNLIQSKVIEQCIDVRLFGATIPVAATKQNEKDSSVTLTGAVQFAMGTSLHRVEPVLIKGTGAFASGQGKQQKTFREEHVLPYGLVAFYGIVNPNAAKTTGMTETDAEALYEAVWYGTKNLITRSKIGQRPLLLLLVDYANPNAYIGRLDRFLSVVSTDGVREEAIRGPKDFTLNAEPLLAALAKRKEQIARVRVAWDERLVVRGLERAKAAEGGERIVLTGGAKDIPVVALSLL
jgi:CRISPR-associated protein Csh2